MATIGRNWECPYCGHAQVLSGERVDEFSHQLVVEGEKGEHPLYLNGVAIGHSRRNSRTLNPSTAQAKPRPKQITAEIILMGSILSPRFAPGPRP